MTRWMVVLSLLMALLVVEGCGRKGDPVAPSEAEAREDS